jgi:hypothetical protein
MCFRAEREKNREKKETGWVVGRDMVGWSPPQILYVM